MSGERLARLAAPGLVGALLLCGWEALVRWRGIPPYVLPGPLAVARALAQDGASLGASLVFTLEVTGLALLGSAALGGLLAVLLAQSRWIEHSLFPYAVVLQVTPIVSIAPLIFIYVDNRLAGLLLCAWIVAFFPILSNTTLGLNSSVKPA